VSSSPTTTPPEAAEDQHQQRRERRGLLGLVVMVVAILAFTAVAIVVEVASNRGKAFNATVEVLGPVPGADNEVQLVFHVANTGSRTGRPDKCEAILYDIKGERVGVAAVSLRQPIAPGETHDEPAIGTAASPPVNGRVHCRSLEPG
jgi:hypothetical protein